MMPYIPGNLGSQSMVLYDKAAKQESPTWLVALGSLSRFVVGYAIFLVPTVYAICGFVLGATQAMTGNANPQVPHVVTGRPATLTSIAYLLIATLGLYLAACPGHRRPRVQICVPLLFTAAAFAAAGGFLK